MRFEEALKYMREWKEVKYRNDVYYIDKKGRLRVRYSDVEMKLVPCFTAKQIMSEEWEINMLKNQKKINISEGNVKENDINVANNVAQRNSQDLTEQWKKGELEQGWYYVLLFSNEEYITFIDGNWVVDDRLIGADIKEVLAEVPSYEQWQQMKAFCEGFNALEVSEENRELKQLLKDCRDGLEKIKHIGETKKLGAVYQVAERTLAKIDEVLK